MAPELTAQVANALSNGQFVNFGSSGGAGGEHGAVSTGSDDVLRVVQTLMAAQIVTGRRLGENGDASDRRPAPPPPFVTPRRG
jgi:flotillin